MTITTGNINVGNVGYTATLTGTTAPYHGFESHYDIATADGTKVGTVRLVETETIRAYAATLDGDEVTTDWLDLFNEDSGDRDENTALDRAADAIAIAKGDMW